MPNICPLDDRYKNKTKELSGIFSEFGLMKYRTFVEIQWLIFLSDKGIAPTLSAVQIQELKTLGESFSEENFEAIKVIEKTTNHDVKAVEIFLQTKTEARFHPWIHFGCTSEDINATSYALMLQQGTSSVFGDSGLFAEVLALIKTQSSEWKSIPMMSRTHGQPATPTTVGREWAVFSARLQKICSEISATNFIGKFGGAVGNFAAHSICFPEKNWPDLAQEFVEKRLKITWNPLTTQIEPHDDAAKLLNEISRMAAVLIDFSRDIWGYISIEYFGQKTVAGEVGSSTMPHKVNPIDFENAEGNLKLARGIARTLAEELPISRWQRDLTDSTLQRNYGLVFGYFFLALKSLQKGLNKLEVRKPKILSELLTHPELLTEAVQMVLRKNGVPDAYDQMKKISRAKKVTLEELQTFIRGANINETDKKRLLELTPEKYIGVSEYQV